MGGRAGFSTRTQLILLRLGVAVPRDVLRSAGRQLVLALGSSLAALVLWLLLERTIQPNPFPLFLAAVVLSALYGGTASGLLASLCGALASLYFFVTPRGSIGIESGREAVDVLVYVFVAVTISWLSHRRLRAEKTLRLTNERLADALTELRETQSQLVAQERLMAAGEATGRAVDEVNAILGPVAPMIDVLIRQPDQLTPQQRRALLEAIKDAALGTVRMMETAGTSGDRKPKIEALYPVDLEEVIQDAIAATSPKWHDEAAARGIEIEIHHAIGPTPMVAGREHELQDVLVQILLNAVEAMPDGGAITIGTESDGRQVRVTVVDTGVGMTEEVQSRCLEPFFTGSGLPGQGLGLTIANSIIRRHQGTLEIESEPGSGTAITITLRAWVPRQRRTEVA